jgi:hypothetical protein
MGRTIIAFAALALLEGCLARTAVDVVTAPVKIVSKGVDAVTTSQSEADEKRGRAMRQREERLGKLSRQRDRLAAKCADGSDAACAEQGQVQAEIDREIGREI